MLGSFSYLRSLLLEYLLEEKQLITVESLYYANLLIYQSLLDREVLNINLVKAEYEYLKDLSEQLSKINKGDSLTGILKYFEKIFGEPLGLKQND